MSSPDQPGSDVASGQPFDGAVADLRAALAAVRSCSATPVLPDDVRHELMRAAVTTYAQAWQDRPAQPLADPGDITATEAVVTASGLIRSLNIELFELAMWQTQTAV
jgi:hypothetical protein